MAANLSQRKLRQSVLMAPIEQYRAHTLLLACKPCDRSDVLELAEPCVGPTVGAVVGRLRCPTCRALPSEVILSDPDGRRPVRLEGRGAYG